jgi:hypothetical protein
MMILIDLYDVNPFNSIDFHDFHDVNTLSQLENDEMRQQVVFNEAFHTRNTFTLHLPNHHILKFVLVATSL